MTMIDRLGPVLQNQQNPPDVGGGVYVEEDFTLTTTGDLSDNNLSTDELGGGWLTENTAFTYESDSSGLSVNVASSVVDSGVVTDGREDVQVTQRFVAGRGSANSRWQGTALRATGGYPNGVSVYLNGGATNPSISLYVPPDGASTPWNLGALMTTPPDDGDTVEWVWRCTGDDIVLYSVAVNGGSAEIIDSAVTLTGTAATNFGAGSGADRYGMEERSRTGASGARRFEYFKVESIPA